MRSCAFQESGNKEIQDFFETADKKTHFRLIIERCREELQGQPSPKQVNRQKDGNGNPLLTYTNCEHKRGKNKP